VDDGTFFARVMGPVFRQGHGATCAPQILRADVETDGIFSVLASHQDGCDRLCVRNSVQTSKWLGA
jgi:hypothetical protein